VDAIQNSSHPFREFYRMEKERMMEKFDKAIIDAVMDVEASGQ
jgi:hypothetical protein